MHESLPLQCECSLRCRPTTEYIFTTLYNNWHSQTCAGNITRMMTSDGMQWVISSYRRERTSSNLQNVCQSLL